MADWDPEANDLFRKAVESPSPEARCALLEEGCAGNAALRAQVEALLRANEQAGTFLKLPAIGLALTTEDLVREGPSTGTLPYQPGTESGEGGPQLPTVAGYAIEGVLGRGGMGMVYTARHLALKRTVALKMVLSGGHASAQEVARFRFEAEAVARLQHPNIVQEADVQGRATGQPGAIPLRACELIPDHRRKSLFDALTLIFRVTVRGLSSIGRQPSIES